MYQCRTDDFQMNRLPLTCDSRNLVEWGRDLSQDGHCRGDALSMDEKSGREFTPAIPRK